MASSRSQATFELLSGLFGWVWIAAAIGVLVAVGLAFFGDWSWWNVLYLFLLSGIAKWLARGFIDNVKRVNFEQAMIAKGATQEEAATAWLDAYSGR